MPLKLGMVIGDWTLHKRIGGNGEVWRATDSQQRIGALKALHQRHHRDAKRSERFRREIRTMETCLDVPGVLPLWASCLTQQEERNSLLWLVTPLSQPLDCATGGQLSLDGTVALVASLALTLQALHARGISHRDIKPENIFRHADRWCLGDFGLVATNDDLRLTETGERIGAAHYIAPEMLNEAIAADGKKADVYSIAKLLWRLATSRLLNFGPADRLERI